ncbi:MAG: TetR/AcrR family transcriptional regulator, partial [Pontibacterium sp.]
TGYTATSISELVKVTHLKPGSLYGAFNSKRGLFLEVLNVYAHNRQAVIKERLASQATPLTGLRHYLNLLIEEMDLSSAHAQTDLVIKTMVELGSEDTEIRDFAKQHLDAIELLVSNTLSAAQASGEIGEEANPAMMARFIVTNIVGMRVTGNAYPKREEFEQIIEQMLTVLAIKIPTTVSVPVHSVSA